jgi:hypothetical protein
MDGVIAGRFSHHGRADFAGAVSYTPIENVSAANVYIDWERANRQVLTLTSDVNVYFVNPYSGTFHLLVQQEGDWVVTWKVNDTNLPVVAWTDGAPLVVTTGGAEAAPVYDTFSFSYWEELSIYIAMGTQDCKVPI